jgi:DNA-binding GntR family transcriptional regulator
MKKTSSTGTLSEQAYRAIKRGILRGEFPEGRFLSEAEISKKYGIGHTPFREACSRLLNDQILEAVPRHGFRVPELSFRAVRDLLETRLILQGVAAEIAANRAEPDEILELDRLYRQTIAAAKNHNDIDAFVEANRDFHLQIARMTHNLELESLLRGVLDRVARLVYLVVRSSASPERDAEMMLKPIVEAIKQRNPTAAHEAVINDITRGQLNVFGRDLWVVRTAERRRKK